MVLLVSELKSCVSDAKASSVHDYSVRGHARERQIYLLAALAFTVMPLRTSLSGWIGVSISIGTPSGTC